MQISSILTRFSLIAIFMFCFSAFTANCQDSNRPNFVVIFTDDQGYGDLGCYGHPTIKTPNIDKMALEGQRWTSFYSAANVCTPSRAALLTGRHAVRSGMYSKTGRRVLFPDSDGGLPSSEVTLATQLQRSGYRTACVGKWHLGHLPKYLPTSHGFDYYYGIPYSNDMDLDPSLDHAKASISGRSDYFRVPLMRNTAVIERPAEQSTLTKRYTEEAVKFIGENKAKPFFIYLAHSMPHVPLFASKEFIGKSERGLYGDVIQEIDWSVGEVIRALKEHGLDKNTIVLFTSDNGPWALFKDHGGSAGPLRGAKGTSYEGGVRVPAIFWGPGRISPGIISDIGSTLDILPTIAKLSRIELPTDRQYDGYDLSPVLLSKQASSRKEMIYYHENKIFAARKGDFKLCFYRSAQPGSPQSLEELSSPELYNLQHDPSEKYDVADKHPEIIRAIEEMVQKHRASFEPGEPQLDKRLGK